MSVIQRLFDWKIRGFRWIELIGVLCVAVMIFSVYLAKTAAAHQSSQIASLERDIAEHRQRVRLLRAEVTRLEQPGRLEALSRTVGLAPVEPKQRATADALTDLAPEPEPKPVIVAPTPATPDLAPAEEAAAEVSAAEAEAPE